jgi:deoxyadenosine/deoxycytidine kinase
MGPIFTVEGVVGAGKTSLLEKLKNTDFGREHVVIFEPVDDWQIKVDGEKSIFEKFYNDKEKYGFAFQMLALQTRTERLLKAVNQYPNSIILCERSYISDAYIFVKLLLEVGAMNQEEHYVYKKWYDMCYKHLLPRISGVIYIDTPPATCIERILQRNRKGEEQITFDYIQKLYNIHEDLVKTVDLPVCILNGKININDVEYDTNIAKLVNFCNTF